jgi:hypothetical protein
MNKKQESVETQNTERAVDKSLYQDLMLALLKYGVILQDDPSKQYEGLNSLHS